MKSSTFALKMIWFMTVLMFLLSFAVGIHLRIQELSTFPPPGATPTLTRAGLVAFAFGFIMFQVGTYLGYQIGIRKGVERSNRTREQIQAFNQAD